MKYQKINIEIPKLILLSILIGLIFPLIAWIIEFSSYDMVLNFSTFIYIHSKNKLLFIVDLAPLILAIITYFVAKRSKHYYDAIYRELTKYEELLQKNTEIAMRIGKGDYNFSYSPDKTDTLGQTLLQMRDSLLETKRKEAKLSWIAKGKEIISDILRIQNRIDELAYQTLVALVDYTNSVQGAFYIWDEDKELLENVATYAYNRRKYLKQTYKIGEGLIGAAAYEKEIIYRTEIPDNYLTITSGLLNEKKPKSLIILPLIGDEKLQGVIEIASLNEKIPDELISLMQELSTIIGQTVFNLKINQKTERLLQDSREMTQKLRKNEEELRKSAEEMKKTQKELEETNRKLANQIAEVERARERLYALLENASEIISIYNQNGIITYESPNIKNILGYKPEDLVGKNGFTVFDEETNNKFKIAFYKLIENPDKQVTFEYQFKKGEEEIWLETTGRNLIHNPAINGIIFNTRDITVRKIAEKAQRMSGRMQALSENSPDMIVRIDLEGKFYYANPIAEEYLNIGRKNLIGNKLNDLTFDETIKQTFITALNSIKQNAVKYSTETTFHNPEKNEDLIVQFNAIPEFNEENELETILFVAHDITLQKQIQLEIEQKNKSITESINYARRIQQAILPTEQKIQYYLPKSFLFYLPRDVVSGDIPWIFPVNDEVIYIAAIDCTGHGVPGALLSFIGYFILNNIVSSKGLEYNSGQVLDELHIQVRKTLNQDKPDAEQRDGMDIALCKIDYREKRLDFAGAHRPLFYARNEELIQYKGTLKAIGGIPMKNKVEKNFENYTINYQSGDKIFFFSDGLADQVNEEGEKFKTNRIKKLLEENLKIDIFDMKNLLHQEYLNWKGSSKQIDDILFIGVEL